MKINLNNIIKIDLTNDKWGRIVNMNNIDGKMVFQFELDGYTAVWLEKMNGNHRLIAYTKDGFNHISGKFLNNISKANQEIIFRMNNYPVPSDSEYRSFLNTNSNKILKSVNSPQKRVTTKSKKVVTEKIVTKKVIEKSELEVLSIDTILDKIGKNGIDSLTNNEKRFLDEESKKI